jgi:hypothetical protein
MRFEDKEVECKLLDDETNIPLRESLTTFTKLGDSRISNSSYNQLENIENNQEN